MNYQAIIKAIQAQAEELTQQYQLPEAEPQKLQKLQAEFPLFKEIADTEYFFNHRDYDRVYLNLDATLSLGMYSALDYTINGPAPLKTINEEELLYGRKELELIKNETDYMEILGNLARKLSEELKAVRNKEYQDDDEAPVEAIEQVLALYQQLGTLGLRYYQKESFTKAALSIRGHQLTEEQLKANKYTELTQNHWLKHFFIDNKVIKGMCLELVMEQGSVKDYEITYSLIPDVLEMTHAQDAELNKWLDNSPIRKEILKELEALKQL